MVLSRFRAGLKEDLQCEILLCKVSTLQHAYQMVQELDRYPRFQTKKFKSAPQPNPSARPPGTQAGQNLNHGLLGAPPTIDKGKTQVSTLKGPCFRCNQPGHHAAQCPKRSLAIETREDEEE